MVLLKIILSKPKMIRKNTLVKLLGGNGRIEFIQLIF